MQIHRLRLTNDKGDVLNFGMAVEKAKATGLDVEMVVVGDDTGVGRKKGGKVGRRGIAGTVLVQKIAGALAAKGCVHFTMIPLGTSILLSDGGYAEIDTVPLSKKSMKLLN